MRRLIVSLVLSVLTAPAFAGSVIISEYLETPQADRALELYNASSSVVNLSNYRIRMFFNGSPSPTTSFFMSGTIAPNSTYVIVQNGSTTPSLRAKANLFSAATWYDGNDAVVLYDAFNNVVDSIGQVGVNPGTKWGTTLTSTADADLRRKATVTSGDTNPFDTFDPEVEWNGYPYDTLSDFGLHTITAPPVTSREIFEIQGSGAVSADAGQFVETRDNIVTAVGPQGFFLQTPDYRADASSATSNGIYVFTGSAPNVAVGDQVDVKGTVAESAGMTTLSGAITISLDAHNMPLPSYFNMPAGYSNFEPLEGMLVRVQNATAAAGTDASGETMVVVGPRPFRAPGVNGGNHPELFDIDPTALGGAAPSIIGGATITLAQGPFAFDAGDYSVWATTLQYTNPSYPRIARARNAGELTVAAQNLFSLFDNRDNPALAEPVAQTAAYNARLAKISQHVRANLRSPDILAVSEVEDIVTLQDLAARINADEPGLNYMAYLQEGHDGSGADVGFLVRNTVTVDTVQQLGANDTWSDPDTNASSFLNDRPPLLLRARYTANGLPFAINVIAVQQQSFANVATSASVRQKRQQQAQNLVAMIQALYASEPNARLVVTGDFNAFEFNDGYVDVLGILTSGASLTNRVLTVSAPERYSFVDKGVAELLDHSLTSAALNNSVRGLNLVHANADATAASGPASDRDGVVLYVMSDRDGDGFPDDNDSCAAGDARPTVILGTCDSGVPNFLGTTGCTLADQLKALKANAKNQGQYVSDVGKLLNDLMKSGKITGAQKGAIESCAARK